MFKLSLLNRSIFFFMLCGFFCQSCASSEVISRKDTSSYIDTLRNALQEGESFFIKVHAAEALITNGETAGVEQAFLAFLDESKLNRIGASRVLAKLYKNNYQQYEKYTSFLIDEMRFADSLRQRLTALESLAKVDFKMRLPQIVQYADTGTNGFKGMARWVLSNSGSLEDEAYLAELLTSPMLLDYRYAAYAFRFKNTVSNATYKQLRHLNERTGKDDPAKVYIISTLFVHAPKGEVKQAKQKLLAYSNATPGEKYEVAEALAIKGDSSNVNTLRQLLQDANRDVRVAAANALLRINGRVDKIKGN